MMTCHSISRFEWKFGLDSLSHSTWRGRKIADEKNLYWRALFSINSMRKKYFPISFRTSFCFFFLWISITRSSSSSSLFTLVFSSLFSCCFLLQLFLPRLLCYVQSSSFQPTLLPNTSSSPMMSTILLSFCLLLTFYDPFEGVINDTESLLVVFAGTLPVEVREEDKWKDALPEEVKTREGRKTSVSRLP